KIRGIEMLFGPCSRISRPRPAISRAASQRKASSRVNVTWKRKQETLSPASALSHSARLPLSHCVSASARWLTRLVGWWHDRNRDLYCRDPGNRVGHTGRALRRRAQRAAAPAAAIVSPAPLQIIARRLVRPPGWVPARFAVVHPTLKLLSIKTDRCSG